MPVMTLTVFWKGLLLVALALVPGTLLLLPLWVAFRKRAGAAQVTAPVVADAR
jgi:hypothetical protein